MEYARPAIDPRSVPQGETEVAAFLEFMRGLQMMSVNFERLTFDFAWAAAQIAGSPDAPERIRGMMEFAFDYHLFGLDRALTAIDESTGVPVNILKGRDGGPVEFIPGRIVGLVGAHFYPSGRLFDGVAAIEDSRGRERFIAVSIRPDGLTQIHLKQYDYSKPDWLSEKSIEAIFPQRPTGVE